MEHYYMYMWQVIASSQILFRVCVKKGELIGYPCSVNFQRFPLIKAQLHVGHP